MAKSEKHIVRVFFSSPFGGMEIEREELTKKYWPRLSSMCSRAGFEFVPVDLRWGITSEMSSNASTIEVCLKELDRSDMIIGFFGQRYGWHGDNELLQKSFDVAITKYPWLNEYRDKSVTELEFLHGHLNNPGDRAACFYFRDKAYDDEMLAKYESENNEEESRKYQSITDGEDAAQCLTELKKKVKDTEDKCLQFVEEYPNPEAGAELMFEAIKNHLQTILKPLKKLTEREEKLSLQNAYYASHLGVGANQEYIGGETYLKEVDRHVMKDDENFADKPLLIVGDSGVGKTTLLSNWLHRHQQTHPDDIIAYHFVGCAPKTTSETDVLSRIVEDLKYGYKKKHNEKYEDEKNENVKSEKPKTVLDYYRELQEVLSLINENGYHAVIIIDGVNKMDDIGKTKKELYWLPKDIPKGVSLLISCLKDDISKTDEFNERQFDILSVEKLNTEQKEQMMQAILSLRGKELSSEQKLRLMNKEETENPLYLKILLQELVNFGDFFKLDDHIDYILQANSTTELFMKILERLEKDFNSVDSEDNVVAKVMSCILVSRYGLSDQEIKSIINLPDQLWSSIYFALEDFLIDREGIYGFAYDELSSAVKERYCHGNDNIDMVAAFFENKLKELGPDHRVNIPSRIINELPWLLEKFGDQERLQNCLLHLAIFLTLFRNGSKYDLFGYWNSTELSGEEISSLYMKSIDQQLVNMYLEQLESSETPDHPPAKELLSVAIEIASFLYDAGHFVNAEPLLLRARRMHGFSFSEDEIEANKDACDKYCEIIGNLANLYVDLERFEEGEKLHKENLEMRKNWPDSSTEAMTMNGLGVLYLNQKKFEEVRICK
uniref:TPR repeat-containing protein DDB_G0287407-like n=1 Tax=Saccoglossus kowalevskii TaxID=10224 RepID=A0ABM0M8M0_SACKO|nr:PREDICTED: TPR repeat-containing protein DDB_G0287407-like [Saccoglossus kowalevskii]